MMETSLSFANSGLVVNQNKGSSDRIPQHILLLNLQGRKIFSRSMHPIVISRARLRQIEHHKNFRTRHTLRRNSLNLKISDNRLAVPQNHWPSDRLPPTQCTHRSDGKGNNLQISASHSNCKRKARQIEHHKHFRPQHTLRGNTRNR